MDGEKYVSLVNRDAQLVAAWRGSLEAMMLTHGAKIIYDGVIATLNFEQQMLSIRSALVLLCVDPDEPVRSNCNDE